MRNLGYKAAAALMVLALAAFSYDSYAQSRRPESRPSASRHERPDARPAARPQGGQVRPSPKPGVKPGVKPGGHNVKPVKPRPVVRPRPVIRPSYGTIIASRVARDMTLTAVNMAYVNSLIRQNNALAAQLGVVQSLADAKAGYLYQDGTFYVQNARGEYEVIVPPAGALVEALPDDFETLSIDGKEYYRVDDTIYGLTIVDGKAWFEVIGQLYR